MKIYLGADHAGFKLKEAVKNYLKKEKHDITDKGNTKLVMTDDYPDYAYKVAKAVAESKGKAMGILFCGSSHGICIAANKVKGIRAVAVANERDAKLTREHNDANVLCLSGWNTPPAKAKKIIRVWLKTEFTYEPRHVRRIKKILLIEQHE
ncbi:MAG: ribose 5-phosphate isomerase B [Candidatus Woesearchaeota archaeon]